MSSKHYQQIWRKGPLFISGHFFRSRDSLLRRALDAATTIQQASKNTTNVPHYQYEGSDQLDGSLAKE